VSEQPTLPSIMSATIQLNPIPSRETRATFDQSVYQHSPRTGSSVVILHPIVLTTMGYGKGLMEFSSIEWEQVDQEPTIPKSML
jgi:hypothetical protein